MNSDVTARADLRPRIELSVLTVLFLAVFAPVMVSLVNAWNTRPDASHGWFVLPIAAYITWRRRDDLRSIPAASFWPALILLVAGLLAAVISARAALESVGRIALVLTINGLLLYLMGPARYRKVAFPALFLFLLVPVPITITGAVTFPLQIFASALSEASISLIGIPVTRMGNVLSLPGSELEVAEACSGLRSLMSFVTLGALLAWVTPRWAKKAAVLVLALPAALFANILRITLTAALVHWFGPGAAEGWAHEAVGITSFMSGIALYAAAAKFLGSRWAA